MARYWFHIVCGVRTYPDEVGYRFRSAQAALAHAAAIEREIAAAGDAYCGCTIRVVDEQDRVIGRLVIGKPKS